MDLQEWLINLWGGRYFILGSLLVFFVTGLFYIWRATPIFQAEALLQIEPPKLTRDSDAPYTRMESHFSSPSDASTEIEIIGSNLVLGRTLEALNLDLEAEPTLFPFIGKALIRGEIDAPRLEVAIFEIPEYMRGLVFQISIMPGGEFSWKTPTDPPTSIRKSGVTYPVNSLLATGRTGDVLVGSYGGETLRLQLRQITGKIGQRFKLTRRPLLDVISDLRKDLQAAEKGANQPGKSTNLLALSFRHSNPVKAAQILNEIMNQYIRQNRERKSEEITSTLDVLQHQLSEVQSKLKLSENQLNGFRSHTGSVDIPREADLALQQSSNLTGQISALKQRKQEMLRTYQEGSDVVSTLNSQIAKLESESAAVNQKVRALPSAQQEVVRLSRDVQVNTELYTALLNNIKQLQVTQVGETHNTRVVDFALPSLKPVKPKKAMLLAAFLALGLFLGVGFVIGQMALRRGLEDHRIIESKLGLPVLATVPHSVSQEQQYKALSLGLPGSHLLAHIDTEDLATESLRSLRTMLTFSTTNASNCAIMITGPSPSVGKSFISSNLAVVLAQSGARVLVVDADLRRGNLHKYFGLPNRIGGLSEVISGPTTWKSVVHQTEIPELHIIRSGRIPKNPAELLMSPRFDDFLRESLLEYDHLVIDAPPMLPVTDATIIGTKVGTVRLVTKFGQNSLDEIRTCQSRMESNRIPLRGCIFNDIMPIGLGYFDQRYRYAYHYKY